MYKTREEWLNAAVGILRGWFEAENINLPDAIRVSCGWSKRAGKNSIGWCWKRMASGDKTSEILISPEIDDGGKVLATLVHELCHAHDDGESGHSGEFRRVATLMGLEGKMTATVASGGLNQKLAYLLQDKLGKYPHAAINPAMATVGKQSTRMIKLSCPDDGYTVRTTKKWIDQGMPSCPCGEEMELSLCRRCAGCGLIRSYSKTITH